MVPVIWLIGLSLLTGVIGQTSIKIGVAQPAASGLATSNPFELILTVVRSPLILLGLAFYAIGAAAWIVVLSRVQLSFAYPFVALNFVLITVVSRFVLSETVPGIRWVGIAVICLGILIVARSGNMG